MKTIAVLTSGGDAPGMNAAVRAVAQTALSNGMTVYGIKGGYKGLVEDDMELLDVNRVSDVIRWGGTFLLSSRYPKFAEDAVQKQAVAVCKKHGIEGVVVIGGDGSFRGAKALSEQGIPCIGIPGTIDNDIVCTDYTIGYDTCLNTILDMVDRMQDTIASHSRCIVVEVMGRDAGWLALNSAIAVGATAVIVPEIPHDIDRDVIARVQKAKDAGKTHFVVIVSEGIGGVEAIAKRIEAETGVESRAVVLAHVQRGGSPTVQDRVAASRMGNHAVKLLMQGTGNRVVVMQKNEVLDLDIHEGLAMTKSIDKALYELAYEVSL